MKFDGLDELVVREHPVALDALQRHLVTELPQCLVDEDFEALLLIQLANALRNLLNFVALLLLVLHFPEPFVNLVFFHFELLGDLDSLLTRRHLSHTLLVDFPECLHLMRPLPIATVNRAFDAAITTAKTRRLPTSFLSTGHWTGG